MGGPIKKNQLFFFASVERTARRWYASQLVTIPPLDQRRGDFSAYSAIYDPITGNADATGRTPFPGNLIPASRQSRVAQQLISWLPQPTNAATSSNYFAGGDATLDRDCEDGKVNWNPSAKVSLFGRFGIANFNNLSPTIYGKADGSPIDSTLQAGPSEGRTISTAIGVTYIVTPTLVVDGNTGYTRLTTQVTPWDYGQNIGLDVLKIPGTNGDSPFESGIPSFVITGYSTIGTPGNTVPYFWHDNQFQYNGNASWTKGSHSIRFGFDPSRQDMNHKTAEQGAGSRSRIREASPRCGEGRRTPAPRLLNSSSDCPTASGRRCRPISPSPHDSGARATTCATSGRSAGDSRYPPASGLSCFPCPHERIAAWSSTT